ncbi:MAG: FAD-binding oxidoreductase [Phototrophicales bacterium]|nr:MAG: FAD-binding oxidoreductase [Phototrophicales bacterium]
MRRWNGWGDTTHQSHLPAGADDFLQTRVGASSPPKDATLNQVLGSVPNSRLKAHPLIKTDNQDRLLHARGQSFPDWLALRTGQIGIFPDGVAYPVTEEDVRALIAYAKETDTKLIPYGGGTSVVGHINPQKSDQPVLTVDMGRMNRLIHLDGTTRLATFGAGIAGPDLEALLRAQGFTLGHYPQSFEYSTLGGWIAARSSGQQSLYYGRIEQLFAGGRMEAPIGTLDMPPFPASAAGPDLRQWVLGSEGRMGIITQATVRISPQPEVDEFRAVFFPDFESGIAAVREIVQARLPLSMLRYSTTIETETNLALAGKRRLIGLLEDVLSTQGIKDKKTMFIFGVTGSKALARLAVKEVHGIAGRYGGVHLRIGKIFGGQWRKNRFHTPYLRNTLWDAGYAVDTVETSTDWTNTPTLIALMERALHHALADVGEKVHVFTHLSHLYPFGTSIYTTYVFRIAPTPDETLRRWASLKEAVSRAIVDNGGTISHQHGVGYDHMPYLSVEKGELGIGAIQSAIRFFDPNGLMNPNKLV